MPDLPGIKGLSQAHFDRIVASFPGATLAERAAAYERWLINRLIERVEMVESMQLDRNLDAQRVTARASLKASLPPRAEEPGPPSPIPGT